MKFLECCNLQWENGEQPTNGDGEQPHREHNGGVANTKINGSDLAIHLFTSYCIFLSQDHLDPHKIIWILNILFLQSFHIICHGFLHLRCARATIALV